MLHGPAESGECWFVPDVLEPELTVEAEEQVGAPLVGAERLDEYPVAIDGLGEVGRRSAGVDLCRIETG